MRTAEPQDSRWLFFRKLWRHGTQVASIAPSSPALCEQMCSGIDPHTPQVIVELGAGTGAVTRVATERMHPDSRLLAIELDPDFVALARRAAPRAEIVQADVAGLPELARSHGISEADVVLSGLPVPSLPRAINRSWLWWLSGHPGASFHQLTVMPWVYRSMYQQTFEEVTFALVTRNLPPGGVYHCRGVRQPLQVPGRP